MAISYASMGPLRPDRKQRVSQYESQKHISQNKLLPLPTERSGSVSSSVTVHSELLGTFFFNNQEGLV